MHSFIDTQGTYRIFIVFLLKEEEIRLIFIYFSLHEDAFIKIKANTEKEVLEDAQAQKILQSIFSI